MKQNSKEMILIYNPNCPLTRKLKTILHLLDLTGIIEFCPVHTHSIYAQYPHLINYVECLKEIHVIAQDKVYRGQEALHIIIENVAILQKCLPFHATTYGKYLLSKLYHYSSTFRSISTPSLDERY